MQLCKELCKYDRVVYNSLEEGACLTVQNNLKMHGMSEVSRRLAFIQEDMEALKPAYVATRVITSWWLTVSSTPA